MSYHTVLCLWVFFTANFALTYVYELCELRYNLPILLYSSLTALNKFILTNIAYYGITSNGGGLVKWETTPKLISDLGASGPLALLYYNVVPAPS